MIFTFTKKKIILDCFTSEEHIIKTAPIANAIKHVPDWWKVLPPSYYADNDFTPKNTMKKCAGMVEYYKKSVVIPLWTDLIISVKENTSYSWQFSDRVTTARVHNVSKQASGFLTNFGHLKIDTPWLLQTKETLGWVWSHPTYNYAHSYDLVSLPAIVDYSHQSTANINLMINLQKAKDMLLPQGQPLAFLTPMTDRKVVVERHLVSEAEYRRRQSLNTTITFSEKYKNLIERTKQFKDCPYHKKLD